MIFDLTKKYVPEAYVESRDFRVFLRQLGMFTTVMKYNIDHFTDLYSPENCPEHMLPLLATMVGYEYDSNKSVLSNRIIISYFPFLLRNRGSELGIKLAVALAVNTDPSASRIYSIDSIIIDIDVETGVVNIYYPDTEVVDWSLVEYVRPVGTVINYKKSNLATGKDVLQIRDSSKKSDRDPYYDQSTLGDSLVGFSVNDDTREE